MVWSLLLSMALVACGGGGANSSAGTENVGSAGGTVASSDGVVQLEIPAGALLGATTFSFAPIDSIPNLPADVTLLPGTAYQIVWTGAGFTQDGAATIRLRNSGTNQATATMEVSAATPSGLEGTVLMCLNGAPAYVMPEQVGTYLQFNYTMGACPAQGADVGRVTGNAPAINQQPASASLQEGATANFSVTASGSKPLSYQWRRNGTNIAGATDSFYSVTVSSASNGDGYSVVVSNIFGSVTSNVATLTVSAQPVMPPWTFTGSADEIAARSATDKKDGSVYLTGFSDGLRDAFLAKFDSVGALKWAINIGSDGSNTQGYAVAVDSAQNVYIVGDTTGSLNGVTYIGGDYDAFIAKYNKDGVQQWTKLLGTTAIDSANAIAIDVNDNIYITGISEETLDSTEQPSANEGKEHVFVARYNTAGDLQWVQQMWSLNAGALLGVSVGTGITTDSSSGNVYVAGYTNTAFAGTTSNGGTYDAFLVKYNPEGVRQWIRQFGTEWAELPSGVACDSAGNVYTSGTVSTKSSGLNGFLYQHDKDGNFQWVRSIGSETAYEPGGNGVVVDSSDGIFVAGGISGVDNLNGIPLPGWGSMQPGSVDLYVTKYDTKGTLQWTQLWGTTSQLSVFNPGVVLSSDGGILVSGTIIDPESVFAIIHKFVSP